jgi:hypothetical protein
MSLFKISYKEKLQQLQHGHQGADNYISNSLIIHE